MVSTPQDKSAKANAPSSVDLEPIPGRGNLLKGYLSKDDGRHVHTDEQFTGSPCIQAPGSAKCCRVEAR